MTLFLRRCNEDESKFGPPRIIDLEVKRDRAEDPLIGRLCCDCFQTSCRDGSCHIDIVKALDSLSTFNLLPTCSTVEMGD